VQPTFRTVAGRVDIADPPEESRLHLGVAGIVFLLQVGHYFERMRRGQVGVDDAVAQASMRLLLLDQRVGVHNPVHGAIANRMGSHRHAVLVEQADHFSINRGVNLWVPAIARPRTCNVRRRAVAQPIVINPSGARATRAIHVNLYSTGEQAVVAETRRHARNSRDLGQRFARGLKR